MGRKVFISFLGYTNYGACSYYKDDFKSESLRYIQEATLKYITSKETWGPDCVAYILLTKGAEVKNWVNDGHKTPEGVTIKAEGLCSRLSSMNLPFPVEPIKNLPDGNNEEEIWEIFERVFEKIQDGDELYFDLTHGFRYLPMLILVLGNYAKFLSNVVIKHVSYGNYDGRNRQTNEALIIDLLPLISLQDWTFAAANFLENGNVKQLTKLSQDEVNLILRASNGQDLNARAIKSLAKALDDSVHDFQTIRGLNIINAKNIKDVKKSLSQIQEVSIKPLAPIVHKINDSFSEFNEDGSIGNGLVAAKWCLSNGLYQQAATILQETIISFFTVSNGFEISSKERDYVNKAFYIIFYSTPEERWDVEEENKNKLRAIIESIKQLDSAFVSDYFTFADIRNDINHAGMRENPMLGQKLKEKIEKNVELFEKYLTECL